MPQRKPIETADRIRKIGERTEEITVELTAEQIDAAKTNVVDLLGRRDNLEAARKSLASEYKAKIETVDHQMTASARAATTGKERKEVVVEEWLTRDRQVVRVIAETQDVIGRRPARTEELQEALFDERNSDRNAELSFPPPDDAFGP